jgi:SAM-dependent methyltransferase
VHEILRHLRAGELVLDLGSKSGSFDAASLAAMTIRVDLSPPPPTDAARAVRADASRLPFCDHCFAAVIANHSLEHFEHLDDALGEAGRVLRTSGALFIAVPDAASLTDRIYRWLGRGGGHVNAFRSAATIIDRVIAKTALRYAGGRVLCTSLSFLNSRNRAEPAPRKLWLLGGGHEGILRWLNRLFRICDRWLGTRMSVYGWALYFGSVPEPVSSRIWVNVCVRCGSGNASADLLAAGLARRHLLSGWSYTCPKCSATNFFHRDEAFQGMN